MPDLGDLLHDAVDDIEPADRLDAIRARAAASPPRTRRWWYAGGGAALATAAAVAAFAVLGGQPRGDHARPPTTATATESATQAPAGTQVVPVYFIGTTPRGDRLFREYDEVPAGDPVQAALDRLERPAADPDYRTPWTATSFGTVTVGTDRIEVELDVNDLSDNLAVQQVVYTLQAAAGKRLPVWFWLPGQRGNAPYTAAPQAEVLSQVMINDPTEGLAVGAGFTAHGAANSFEANVPWQIRDEGGAVVEQGHATAAGWGDRLYPWSVRIDVRDLAPGFYTFVATTDDPSGGEGPGPDADTRTIIVR